MSITLNYSEVDDSVSLSADVTGTHTGEAEHALTQAAREAAGEPDFQLPDSAEERLARFDVPPEATGPLPGKKGRKAVAGAPESEHRLRAFFKEPYSEVAALAEELKESSLSPKACENYLKAYSEAYRHYGEGGFLDVMTSVRYAACHDEPFGYTHLNRTVALYPLLYGTALAILNGARDCLSASLFMNFAAAPLKVLVPDFPSPRHAITPQMVKTALTLAGPDGLMRFLRMHFCACVKLLSERMPTEDEADQARYFQGAEQLLFDIEPPSEEDFNAYAFLMSSGFAGRLIIGGFVVDGEEYVRRALMTGADLLYVQSLKSTENRTRLSAVIDRWESFLPYHNACRVYGRDVTLTMLALCHVPRASEIYPEGVKSVVELKLGKWREYLATTLPVNQDNARYLLKLAEGSDLQAYGRVLSRKEPVLEGLKEDDPSFPYPISLHPFKEMLMVDAPVLSYLKLLPENPTLKDAEKLLRHLPLAFSSLFLTHYFLMGDEERRRWFEKLKISVEGDLETESVLLMPPPATAGGRKQ